MLSAAMRSGAVASRQKQRCRPALAWARRLPPPDPGNYVRAHRTMPEEMRTLGSPSGSAAALSFAKPRRVPMRSGDELGIVRVRRLVTFGSEEIGQIWRSRAVIGHARSCVAVSPALSRTLPLVGVAGRPCSWADKARLVGEDHRLDATAEVEFAQDAADVGFDRALLEEELGGDLGVGLALGDQE